MGRGSGRTDQCGMRRTKELLDVHLARALLMEACAGDFGRDQVGDKLRACCRYLVYLRVALQKSALYRSRIPIPSLPSTPSVLIVALVLLFLCLSPSTTHTRIHPRRRPAPIHAVCRRGAVDCADGINAVGLAARCVSGAGEGGESDDYEGEEHVRWVWGFGWWR
jgi:hypothetical protein